jgi:hypothetical protein
MESDEEIWGEEWEGEEDESKLERLEEGRLNLIDESIVNRNSILIFHGIIAT